MNNAGSAKHIRFLRFIWLVAAISPSFGQVAVNFSGTVTDAAGAPVAAAAIRLEASGLTATTGADGRFTLTGNSAVRNVRPQAPIAMIRNGSLFLSLPEKAALTITAYGVGGKALSSAERNMDAGSYAFPMPNSGSGLRFIKVRSGMHETLVKALSVDGALRSATISSRDPSQPSFLAKPATAAAAYYDVLTATKSGFLKAYLSLAKADSSGINIKMLPENSPKFSFFITSMKAMQELADTSAGFGGDFRFGETGAGAGLRGADKICATISERSMPGSSVKGWRAFLSVTADAFGKQVDAIDRIGEGPWYDRTGKLLAPKKADLLNTRPANGDPAIQNDLPNENGIPNHRPDPTKPADDNHHMVTGSSTAGKLKSATATCKDWTTAEGTVANGKPSCGFAWPRGIGGTSGANWMSTFDAPGCAAGIDFGTVPPVGSNIIGGGGGYGGFYCFALNP